MLYSSKIVYFWSYFSLHLFSLKGPNKLSLVQLLVFFGHWGFTEKNMETNSQQDFLSLQRMLNNNL